MVLDYAGFLDCGVSSVIREEVSHFVMPRMVLSMTIRVAWNLFSIVGDRMTIAGK